MTIITDNTFRKTNVAPPGLLSTPSTSRVAVREGDDAFLLVFKTPSSGAILELSWAKGSRPLIGERYRIGENNNTVHLTLEGATRDDAGEYTVTAKNIAGESRTSVHLHIKDESFDNDDTPCFLRRLTDLAVKVGTRTRFLVEIPNSSDVKVTWHRNDVVITEDERLHLLHEGNFFCVDVAPVTVEDSGRWTCMAENRSGRASCSCRLNVLVPKAYKAPEFLEELKALLTEQGTVSLECKVVGVPTPLLKWFKDGKEIKAGDVFALSANCDDPTSLGTYTCEATNCMGKTYSSSRVHVIGKGDSQQSLNLPPMGPPPRFVSSLQDKKVKIGTAVTLSCQVAVPPWPRSISWYNTNGHIENNEKYHIMEDGLGGYSIEIYPVEAMDDGEWKIVANSESGVKGISSSNLTVTYPKNYRIPRFLESLKAILTEEGLVSFECKVVGFPTPQLQWFKDGQELRPGDVYQLTGTNSLGSYSCIAKNCMGSAKSTAELTVEDIQNQLNDDEKSALFSVNQPPRFVIGLKSSETKINEPFRFTVQVTVSPEPSLVWYRDDVPLEIGERYKASKETLGLCHLDIIPVEMVDQAEWKCVATNLFGHSVSSGFLKLSIPRHFKKPRFLECLQAVLTETGAVNLECKVIGVPQPILKWYKDGRELKAGDIHKIISGEDGTCCLGTYTCEAHNCMGSVSSSASLLGFEERVVKKPETLKMELPYPLAKNTSLSTINEERTSQLFDTPATEHSVTMDERGDVSFSFDGKEVSISLYETPDLTEEEALQVVEMYAEELSEHISEQNIVELPPLRFTKESSKSGPLVMEAVVIDVTPEYFSSADDDLRTEADFEDVSMSDEVTQQLATPDEEDFGKIDAEFLERALAPLTGFDKSMSSDEPDSFHSISSPKRGSKKGRKKSRDDVTLAADLESQTYATAKKSRSRSASQDKVKKSFDEKIDNEGVVTVSPKKKSTSRSSSVTSDKRKVAKSSSGEMELEKKPISRSSSNASEKRKVAKSSSGEMELEKKTISRSSSNASEKRKVAKSSSGEMELEKKPISRSSSNASEKRKVAKSSSGEMELEKKTISRSSSNASEKRKVAKSNSGEMELEKKTISRSSSNASEKRKVAKSSSGEMEEKKTISRSSSGASVDKERRRKLSKSDDATKPMSRSSSGASVDREKKKRSATVTDEQKNISRSSSATNVEEKPKKRISRSKSGSIDESTQKQEGSQSPARIQKSASGEVKRRVKRSSTSSLDKEPKEENQTLIRSSSAIALKKKRSKDSPVPDTLEKSKSVEQIEQKKKPRSRSSSIDKAKKGSGESVTDAEQRATEKLIEKLESVEVEPKRIPSPVIYTTVTNSLKEIQKGLTNIEEQISLQVNEYVESARAKSNLAALESLTQPIQEIQKGLLLIEQQVNIEQTSERPISPELSIIESIARPIQDFEIGLKLVTPTTQIETTQALEVVRLAVNHLQDQLIEAKEKALSQPGTDELVGVLNILSTPVEELLLALWDTKATQASLDMDQAKAEQSQISVELLRALAQPVQDLQNAIEIAEKRAKVQEIDEPVYEKPCSSILESLAEPMRNLRSAILIIEKQALLEADEDDSVSEKILEKVSGPIEEISRGLSMIEEQAQMEESQDYESALSSQEIIESLMSPIQSLHKGLAQIVQDVLFPTTKKRPSVDDNLISCLSNMYKTCRNILNVVHCVGSEVSDALVERRKLCELMTEPLKEFSDTLKKITQPGNSQEIIAEAFRTPLKDMSDKLFDIEQKIDHRENLQLLQAIGPAIGELKRNVISALFEVEMENSEKSLTDTFNVLSQSFHQFYSCLGGRKAPPLQKSGSSLGKSLDLIKQASEEERPAVTDKISLTILRPLEKPLQELEEGFSHVGQLIITQEDLTQVEKSMVESELHSFLEILSQSFESFQDGWVEIESGNSSEKVLSETNALLSLVSELNAGAAIIEEHLIGFETISQNAKKIVEENVNVSLQHLKSSLIQVEEIIRKECVDVIPELKRVKTACQQLQNCADNVDPDVKENLITPLVIFTENLAKCDQDDTFKPNLNIIVHEALTALSHIDESCIEFKQAIEAELAAGATIESLAVISQTIEKITQKVNAPVNSAVSETLNEVAELLSKNITKLEEAELSVVQPLIEPFKDLNTKIEVLKSADQSSVVVLQNLVEPLKSLQQGLDDLKDNEQNLEIVSQTVSNMQRAVATVQQQTALRVDDDGLPEASQPLLLEILAQPFQNLQEQLVEVSALFVAKMEENPMVLESEILSESKENLPEHVAQACEILADKAQLGNSAVMLQSGILSESNENLPEYSESIADVLKAKLEDSLAVLEAGVTVESSTDVEGEIAKVSEKTADVLTQQSREMLQQIPEPVDVRHETKLEESSVVLVSGVLTQQSQTTVPEPIADQVITDALVRAEPFVIDDDESSKTDSLIITGEIETESIIAEKSKSKLLISGDGTIDESSSVLKFSIQDSEPETEQKKLKIKSDVVIDQQLATDECRLKLVSNETVESLKKAVLDLQTGVEHENVEEQSQSLASLISPLQELSQALEAVESSSEVLEPVMVASTLKNISQCLGQVQEILISSNEATGFDSVALEAVVSPISNLQKSIALLQEMTVPDEAVVSFSESTVLKTLAEELQILQKAVTVVQHQTILETNDVLPDLSRTCAEAAENISERDAVVMTTAEPEESSLQELVNVPLVKTIAQPMQELEKILIQIKEHLTLEADDQSFSDTFDASILETLAEPIKELQDALAVVEHTPVQEVTEASFAESSVVEALAHPIHELHRGLAQIQQQIVLLGASEMETAELLFESLAGPIEVMYRELVAVQEQIVLEPDAVTVSDNTEISMLKTFATPVEEVRKLLAVIEQFEVLETDVQSLASMENPPTLASLAQPIQNLNESVEQIQQLLLESAKMSEEEFMPILEAVAKPVHQIERFIAVAQNELYLEDNSELLVRAENLELLRKLAAPLHELAEGLTVLEQQLIEPNVKSISEDTVVEETKASVKVPSPCEQLFVEEQAAFEADVESLKTDSDGNTFAVLKRSSLPLAAGMQETLAIESVEQQEIMESGFATGSFVSSLSDLDEDFGRPLESIPDPEMDLSWHTEDGLAATVLEQAVMSGLGSLRDESRTKDNAVLQYGENLNAAIVERVDVQSGFESYQGTDVIMGYADVGLVSPLGLVEGNVVQEIDRAETLSEVDSLSKIEEIADIEVEQDYWQKAESEKVSSHIAEKYDKDLHEEEMEEDELSDVEITEEEEIKAVVKSSEDGKKIVDKEAKAKTAEDAKTKADQEAKVAEEEKIKAVKAEKEEEKIKAVKAEKEEAMKKTADEKAKKKAAEDAKLIEEVKAKNKAVEEEAMATALKAEEDAKLSEAAKMNKADEAKKMAEEEAKIKAAEEETKKILEEEKKKLVEEAKAKAAEEAKKQAAEEEAKIKAEEDKKGKALKAAEEEAKKKADEEANAKIAEEEAKKKAAEEEEKAKAAEVAAKKKKAEDEKLKEIAKKKAEEEARKQAAEEEKVKRAEEEVKEKAAEEAKKKADQEAKTKAVEEEAKKKETESAKLKAAEDEVKKKASEDAEKKAKAAEAEIAKLAEQEAEKKAAEEEAKNKAAEEEAKKKKAEEEAKKKAAEEAKLKAEEEAKNKAAKEEAKKKAVEEEVRKAAEEENAKLKKAEEAKMAAEEAEKKAAEDEKAKKAEQEAKKKEGEEKAKMKAAEEEDKNKAAEEDAKKKAAEEANLKAAEEEEKKKKAEEEAKKKAEEEAKKKKAEDEAKKKAAEEAKLKAAEEEAKKKKAEEEAKKKAEEEAKKKAVEEEAKKKAEEEAKKKKAEEEAKKKLIEEEAKKKAAEEEVKKKAVEAEAKKKAEEEAKKKKAEDEAKKKADEQEKAKLQKAEEEEAKKKAAEEEEAKKKAAEEEAKKKAAEEAKLKPEEDDKKKKAAEEEAKKKAEDEAKKKADEQEKAKLQKAEEEAKKKAEEEAKKKKAEEEEKAKLQKAEDEAKKKADEQEKAKLQKAEKEAKKKTEEEAKKKAAEEEAKKKAEEEEKAKLQKAEEEEAKKKAAEEEAKKKAAEEAKLKAEEDDKKKKAAEEEAKKKAEDEAKKKLIEEEAKKKAAEEEVKKKAVEAEAKNKAAEEEAKKKKAEDEAKKKAAEETKLKAEEEKKKKAEEEAKKKAEEQEKAKLLKAEEEEAKKKAAEEEAKKKAAEEAKLKAEEDEKKKKAEEEAKKKKAEDEAKKKAAEEAKAKLQKAEEEAKKKAAEEEFKKKAAEEEKAKLQKAEEEAKKKLIEEEEAKKEAEEETKKKAAEEEAKKNAAEEAKKNAAEEAKKNAAEEEAKKKLIEEEEAKKKLIEEEEAKKKLIEEEEAKKKAEEETKKKAAEKEAKKNAAEEEKAKLQKAEKEAKKKAVEAEAKKKAEEETKKKAAEEEAKKKAAEDEAKKKKAEEEEKAKAAEAEAKKTAAEEAKLKAAEEAKLKASDEETSKSKSADKGKSASTKKKKGEKIQEKTKSDEISEVSRSQSAAQVEEKQEIITAELVAEEKLITTHVETKRNEPEVPKNLLTQFKAQAQPLTKKPETTPVIVEEPQKTVRREKVKKPAFTSRLTDRTVSQGSKIRLTCSVLAEPDPQVKWLRDGTPLVVKPGDPILKRFRPTFEDSIANLEIDNPMPGDSGEYTCVARNAHGEASTTCNVQIYGSFEPTPSAPVFTRPIKDSYKYNDDALTLQCQVKSQPCSKVTWYKNGTPISPKSRYQQSDSTDGVCQLTIFGPDITDNGEYTCRAENSISFEETSTTIQFKGRQHHADMHKMDRTSVTRTVKDFRRPHFVSELTDHLVTSGGTVALQVEIKGAPRPEVRWLRGTDPIPRATSTIRSFEDSGLYTLLLSNASEREAGLYTCRASNAFGHIETTAAVEVIPAGAVRGGKAAHFITRPDDVLNISEDDDIVFTCRVGGDPKPRVNWLKGVKDITITQRTMVEHSDDYFRMILKRATPDDAGTYWILAKNAYGVDRTFITVQVRRRARSLTPGTYSRYKWEYDSNITSEILSTIHDSERYARKETPGPITSEPIVADSGKNWLTLTWQKPNVRGAGPVVAYRIDAWEMGRDGGARWAELGISPVNTYDAFNLKEGTQYKFRITPRNRYGWGEPLITSQPICVGFKPINLPEFTKILPGQLKALLGATIRLECQVQCDVMPSVTWYCDGAPLDLTKPRFNTTFNGATCQLIIEDLKEDDSGRYMCEAVNPVGRVSTFARLLVVADAKIWAADTNLRRGIMEEEPSTIDTPPQFTMRLRDRRVQMTYPVRLTCQAVGFPYPTVVWAKDGEPIKQDDRHVFWNDDHFYTLEISKTSLEDSGTYSVTARNDYGSVTCRCHLVVDKGIRAYVAPEFTSELDVADTVQIGGALHLRAQVEAYPTVGVVWHRDGIRLRPSRRIVMTLDHDGTIELTIAGVTDRDVGVYTCTASNEVGRCETTCRVGSRRPQQESLPIIMDPKIPYSKEPMFLKKPRSTDAIEGDNVIIECEVVGDPKPDVFWLRDFLKPDYYRDAPLFRRVGDGPCYQLEISHVKLDHTGTYSLVARNAHGEAKAVISLQIYAKGQGRDAGMQRRPVTHGKLETLPSFKKGLKDLRCCDGDAVTLECVVECTVAPDIRWERSGRLVRLGGDISADFDGTTAKLLISQVYPEDEGEYTCVAYNALGSVSTSAVLVVDVPEEKENLLTRQLQRPATLLSACSTPRSTPRTTPTRSLSPYTRPLYSEPSLKPKRSKVCSPKFYAVPHNRVAEEGETVRFQCAIAGHPAPWVTWDKNGSIVTPSTRVTITERDDLRVLEITEVTVEDAGLYRVTLENDVGRVEATARLEVIGPHGYLTRVANARARSTSPRTSPAFRRRLVSSIGRLGSRVTLACDARASPSPIPSWYRNGQVIVRSDKFIPTWDGHTAMLEIDHLEDEDAGIFTCVLENEYGRTQCSAELVIIAPDDPMGTQCPQFITGLSDVCFEEASAAELNVQIEGTAPLDVVWVRDGTEIPDCTDFRYVDYGDGRFGLRFADVFQQDAGLYSCEVFNQFGEAITNGHVTVKDYGASAVVFNKKPSSVVVASGRKASFCSRLQPSDGTLRPQLYWAVGDCIIQPESSSKYSVEEEGDVSILHISGVDRTDAGQIAVVARRPCSECATAKRLTDVISCKCSPTTVTADLTVLPDNWASDGETELTPPPRLRSRSLSTSEIEVDLPKMLRTVAGYSADTPALVIRGPADANVLQGETVVLSATYCGQPEPLVRWLKGGQEMKDGKRLRIETAEGMSCLTINAITSDDSGKYVVSVENIHGADCHFASVAVEGPPDPPAGVPTATVTGGNSVSVTWSSPPFDGGHKLAGYIVESLPDNEQDWVEVSRSSHSLSVVVTLLDPSKSYRFRVRAVNIHGSSEPSAPSEMLSFNQNDLSVNGLLPKFVDIESGDVFKAKYNVMEELGKGRYGVVYKVVDTETGQKLAGKFIRCIKMADKEKVKEEIEIMNSLRHPKLLQLASAFESPREMVMVMEYISGGELFERVVADDFQLTERDCILFMRQICEGVAYMHSQQVVHLDLKPENIMCQTRTSHEIKLIDFGLAQRLDPSTPVRVLFGTPEFVPPEIINYEPIGVESDMWSVGVVCYVLLSGLSPFMGENDAETFANITRADFDFDDEAFDAISTDAKDFISSLLVQRKEKRLSATECLANKWMLSEHDKTMGVILSTDKLKKFIIRRKWQKTGNAIRALGRMANLSAASRRNSAASSTGSSPRPSLSAARTMLSLDETRIDEMDEKNRGRICSERSDSGISDCSAVTNLSVPTCDSITEEDDNDVKPDECRSNVDLDNRVDDIRKKFANLSQNIYEMDKKLENVGKQLDDIKISRVPSLKEKTKDDTISNGNNNNVSVCDAVRSPKTVGLSSNNKRAEFLRLQQVFSANTSTNQKVETKLTSATGEAPRTRSSPTFQKTVAFWKR